MTETTTTPRATFKVETGATFWVVATDPDDALRILRSWDAIPEVGDPDYDDDPSVRRMRDDEEFTEADTGDGEKQWTAASFARERPDGFLNSDY